MMPMSGVDVLLKVNTGSDSVPVWTEIAAQRGASIKRSAATIDTSFKGSGNWKSAVAGMKQWSVDADGLYVFGANEFDYLEAAFDNRTPITVELIDTNTGKGFTGLAFITDFPIEAPFDKELTYKLTLAGNGALTKISGAMVEAAKITIATLGAIHVGDNVSTKATALVAAGYTVTCVGDGVKIHATSGAALATGAGTMIFTITEVAHPTDTYTMAVLSVTVLA